MKLETIPPLRIAYIRHTGPYGAGGAQAMEQLKEWAKSRGLLGGDTVILGIAQDDPWATLPRKCRYDACLVLADGSDPPDAQVCAGTTYGGRYAIFTIEHTAQAIWQAWKNVLPELKARGLILDETRPIMERYAGRMLKMHRCELCVPVR